MIHITKKILDQSITKSVQTFYNTRFKLCTQKNPSSLVVTSNVKNFYEDRNVFVTGATGFLGKSLVEKLLRSCPGIKNIYVLVRPKKGEKCEQRVQVLMNCQVFDRLKQESPNAISKVIGVQGDIELPRLGMNDRDYKLLKENVSLVFHSAANISLEAMDLNNFKNIVGTNLGGTKNLLDLCHKIHNMKALVYVSTAFSNIYSPMEMKEMIYPAKETPQQVLEVLKNDNEVKTLVSQLQKENPLPYLYSKKMTENLILKESKSLTVVIVRPSLIGAAWKEPMKGWVDSPTSINAIMLFAGQGFLRVYHCAPKSPFDIVPVDSSANCVISAAWYSSAYKPNIISVFNYVSGPINPATHAEIKDLVLSCSKKNPYNEIFMYPSLKLVQTKMLLDLWMLFAHYLPALCVDIALWITGRKPKLMAKQRKLHGVLSSFGAVRNAGLRCDNRKTYEMWDAMNEDDKQEFDFDLRHLQWPAYIENNCLGLKSFCLKEDLSSLPNARRNLQKKYKSYKFLQATVITTTICCSLGAIHLFY